MMLGGAIFTLPASAQNEAVIVEDSTTVSVNDSVMLGEVTVKGSKVIKRVDGMTYYPPEEIKNSSTSGYGLLYMLSLPNIKVDEISESISATNLLGSVQVRINDVPASQADLQSLGPKSVSSVVYIDNPGVRYGEDVAFVINIIVNQTTNGYVLGLNGMSSFKSQMYRWGGFSKVNFGNSELSFNYSGKYNSIDGLRTTEDADYLLSDGSHTNVVRNDVDGKISNRGHDFQLKYSLAKPEKYAFITTWSTSLANTPENKKSTEVAQDGVHSGMQTTAVTDQSLSPVLDIYYMLHIDKRQTFAANLTATYIKTDYGSERNTDYYSATDKFAYTTDGKTYSLYGELLYENKLKPFTFSSGVQYLQKYINNRYAGDANSLSIMRGSDIYAFAQIKGNIGTISYALGAGLKRQYYSQSDYRFDRIYFRPKATLSYPICDKLKLSYDFTMYPRLSTLQNISDVEVKTNEMEYSKGNPDLQPARVTEHRLTLNYNAKDIYTSFTGYVRLNDHPVMRYYYRTDSDEFISTWDNHRGCNMFYVDNYTSYDIIPEKLTATITAGLFHFVNKMNNATHHYTSFNGSAGIRAYIGNFTLTADIDNGWNFMEGETKGHNGPSAYMTASYKWKNLTIMAYWQQPFQSSCKMYDNEIVSQYVHKNIIARSSDYANLYGLRLSWTLSRGRIYKDVNRRITGNSDTDTGIMK